MAKKKTSGLSIAIVALNIVIVGVVILLVVLVYLHMKEDTDNGRTEAPTPTVSESGTVSESIAPGISESAAQETSDTTADESEETTEETTSAPVSFIGSYDRGFFDNDLFIGDSISTGLYLYSYVDKDNVFAEVGLNPDTAVTHRIDGVTCIEKTSAMQPRNIYIMLGTNGLAFMDGSYMATKMIELIAELEVACPTASIYIITIPPVTAEHEAEGSETMELVESYNSQLRDICAMGGYGCIDLCSLLQDENGYLASRYAEEDGLHFLGDAYIAMLSYVEKCAGSN